MNIGNASQITSLAKELFREERALCRLDGWCLIKEIRRDSDAATSHLPKVKSCRSRSAATPSSRARSAMRSRAATR